MASDNSQSLEKFKNECEGLISQAKEEFGDFQVDYWTFGEHAQKSDTVNYSEVRSNYSELLETITDNYFAPTIGALVIIGDGLYNSGADPVYKSKSLPFPVYTIGVGDTTLNTDAAIRKVNTNKTAYLDTNFPVEVDLSFIKAAGQQTRLSIIKNDKTIYESTIRISGNDYFRQEKISIKAEEPGINNYSVRLEPVNGEENLANNQFDFSIYLISEKQKILFLEHGPHPDISAIIKAIRTDNNYSWDIVSGDEKDIDLNKYDLVIIDQLPDATAANSQLLADLVKNRRPSLYIVGSATSLQRLNNLQVGVNFQQTNNTENASPVLNRDFSLFTIDDNLDASIGNWPPLTVPFGNIEVTPELQVLMSQRVQTIETGTPLIAIGRQQGAKRGIVLGEGLWRWRMYNYLQNGTHESFDNLIRKIVSYLILKPNEDNFNIYCQTEYAEDSPVLMQAELLNESFEPVNEPEVTINLTSEKGTNYSFVFDKSENQYRLNIGTLPAGTYSFEAFVRLGENEYRESGSFQVNKLQLEAARNDADFKTLYQISTNTGGKFFFSQDFKQLSQELYANTRLKDQKTNQLVYQDFIDLKSLFFLILFLLTLEWFLRKYWGSY